MSAVFGSYLRADVGSINCITVCFRAINYGLCSKWFLINDPEQGLALDKEAYTPYWSTLICKISLVHYAVNIGL